MKKLTILAVLAALLALAVAAPVQAQGVQRSQGPTPKVGCAPKGCWPVYSSRDSDVDVTAIQYLLRYRGYKNLQPNNGYFGPQTVQAVKSFQRAKGIPVSGVVDAKTWRALIAPQAYGANNDAVRAIQTELRVQYLYNIPVTGYYGSMTRSDVTSFQKAQGLPATGAVDAATWQALVSAR